MQFKSMILSALAAASVAVATESSSATKTATAAASTGTGIQTFAVRVGMDGTGKTVLKFSPDKITAPVGSVVQFQFMAGNHTVTQSTFDSPCVPSDATGATGFHSGFVPANASLAKGEIPVYSITVNDTKPIWLYCAQAKHCQGGMSMVINENTAANASRSLTGYQSLASSVPAAKVPSKVSGGTSGLAPAAGAGSAASSGAAKGTSAGGAKATGSVNGTSPIATAAADRMAVHGLLAAGAAVLLL